MSSKEGTILLTGANGALGTAIVSQVIQRPDLASNHAIYTVRRASNAPALSKTLSKAAPSRKHQTLDLDLGSLASVRKLAANVNEQVASGKIPPIRALILNAGYQDHTSLTMSDDGFEMTWQVNYLSNFLLVLLLLQSMDKTKGRILIVSSWSHEYVR